MRISQLQSFCWEKNVLQIAITDFVIRWKKAASPNIFIHKSNPIAGYNAHHAYMPYRHRTPTTCHSHAVTLIPPRSQTHRSHRLSMAGASTAAAAKGNGKNGLMRNLQFKIINKFNDLGNLYSEKKWPWQWQSIIHIYIFVYYKILLCAYCYSDYHEEWTKSNAVCVRWGELLG